MADHPVTGAPDPADAAEERQRQKKQEQVQHRKEKRIEKRLQEEAAQAEKITKQKAHKRAYMKAYRARAAASGAAGAASQTHANTWEERLDVGPGVPGRYTVSRTIVPRPPSPEPRRTGLRTIIDKQELLEMLLQHFTLEHAKELLAPTCRQLAASVRDENFPWKALTEFEFDSEYPPDVEMVHELFKQAYPFFNKDELDPFAKWLLAELFRADYSVEDQWEIIFECIPNEGYMPIHAEGRTPGEVTDTYKRWLANPHRRWDVFDMKTFFVNFHPGLSIVQFGYE
jgi:hypothetical protein